MSDIVEAVVGVVVALIVVGVISCGALQHVALNTWESSVVKQVCQPKCTSPDKATVELSNNGFVCSCVHQLP